MEPIKPADLNAYHDIKVSVGYGLRADVGDLPGHVYFICAGYFGGGPVDKVHLGFNNSAEAAAIIMAVEIAHVSQNVGAYASANNHPASSVILNGCKHADGSGMGPNDWKAFALWHLAAANGVNVPHDACLMSVIGAVQIGGCWVMPDGSIPA